MYEKIKGKLITKTDYWMHRFAQWFSSVSGTIQTTIVVIIWVIIEQINPKLDPNGFMLMYISTLYSVCTQNLLAYVGNISAQKTEKSQQMLEQLAVNSVHTMNALMTMMESQEKVIKQQTNMINKLNKLVNQLKDKVEDIEEEIMDEKGEDKI